jgi:arsenite methyltransferase
LDLRETPALPVKVVAQFLDQKNDMKSSLSSKAGEDIRTAVRAGYAQIAKGGGSCCGPAPTCCGSTPAASEDLAKHIGYTAEELAALPDGANMGLSCGNPNALAALQPGEVVLDLGAGGGFDVFIAGRKVGPTGRGIGVDMTPEMLAKARNNIATYRERTGLDNVEFRLGEIEHLPVADASVDVVISNCVINLSPDKPQVWLEIARVLKPGGRVAVSDLALLKPLPSAVIEMVEALVGCVAGAVLVSDTERTATEAGLGDIVLKGKSAYIDGMVDWQDPLYQKIVAHLPPGAKPSDYVTSLEITAHKGTQPEAQPIRLQAPSKGASTLEIYDPAMCCSTGVCGPQVDPMLVRFGADVKWLQEQGIEVRRFNLSQSPAAFVENEKVKQALTEKGETALPLLLVDGQVLAKGDYPERGQLAAALGLTSGENSIFSPAVAELVAIGAAIAANCKPCLKYHYRQAQLLGVSKADMASAVKLAATVKDSSLSNLTMGSDPCCGDPAGTGKSGGDCCDAQDAPKAVAVVLKGKH